MTKTDLDKNDWKILDYLTENSRVPPKTIAKKLNLSRTTVAYKIERMQKLGIINSFSIVPNFVKLSTVSYTIFFKLNTNNYKEEEFYNFLKDNENVLVVDKLLGEWQLLIEVTYRKNYLLDDFVKTIKTRFGDLVYDYEVHSTRAFFSPRQLPIQLDIEKLKKKLKLDSKDIKYDDTDLKLMYELNKDSRSTLFSLGERVGLTYETVSNRIKRLEVNDLIKSYTAQINMEALGYDVYVIKLKLKNTNPEFEKSISKFLESKTEVKVAFMNIYNPQIMIYEMVKSPAQLDSLLSEIREKFSSHIESQNYMLSNKQIKIDLFPKGLT